MTAKKSQAKERVRVRLDHAVVKIARASAAANDRNLVQEVNHVLRRFYSTFST